MHIRDDGLKEKKKYRFNLFEGRETGFQNRPWILSRKRIGQKRAGPFPIAYISPEENHYLTLTRVRSFVKAVTSESRNEFAKGNRMVFPRIACRLLLLFVLAWAWKTRRGVGESVKWNDTTTRRHTRFKIASKGEETAARKIAVHGESDGWTALADTRSGVARAEFEILIG